MYMETKQFFSAFLAGLLGASLFHFIILPNIDLPKKDRQITELSDLKPIVTTKIEIVDSLGRSRIRLGYSGNSPGIWILDEKGVARGIFGLYEDNTAYLGLQDEKGEMIQLMRAYGPNEAPFHIFKTKGTDQMIIGLNSGPETVPFLMTYKKDRSKEVHFGIYEGP